MQYGMNEFRNLFAFALMFSKSLVYSHRQLYTVIYIQHIKRSKLLYQIQLLYNTQRISENSHQLPLINRLMCYQLCRFYPELIN